MYKAFPYYLNLHISVFLTMDSKQVPEFTTSLSIHYQPRQLMINSRIQIESAGIYSILLVHFETL
jgi:hypothetical protein